jgi:DNA polymerase III alpha subunit (gram-positive type)
MNKKQNFLVVDTETGGLSCDEHSILSFAGVAWSVDSEPVKCFDLYIKEDDIKYIPKALEINKIKLDELKKVGFSPKEAVFKLREGLDRVFGVNRKKIQLIAHNAPFDLGFIKRLYRLAGEDFNKDFRGRALDTCSITQFLMMTGKIQGFRASADTLFSAAEVSIPEKDRHTAGGDAWAPAQAFKVIVNKF